MSNVRVQWVAVALCLCGLLFAGRAGGDGTVTSSSSSWPYTTLDPRGPTLDAATAARPPPRTVSNLVSAVGPGSADAEDPRNVNQLLIVFLQFIDHMITLTPGNPERPAPISVPAGDPVFPEGTVFGFDRSQTQDDVEDGVPLNFLHASIDGSAVYGGDHEPQRQAALRTFAGGKLKVDDRGYLPLNSDNAVEVATPFGNPQQMFMAGDVRASEHTLLSVVHTLFVREHNAEAERLAAKHPEWNDEQLYQRARQFVVAFIQNILYNEALPALLGQAHFPRNGVPVVYDPLAVAEENGPNRIQNVFATTTYRFGHSMIAGEIGARSAGAQGSRYRTYKLREMFFRPSVLLEEGAPSIDDFVRDAMYVKARRCDTRLTDELRNFLFVEDNAQFGGLDLAALNIQRGRDHRIPPYNAVRAHYGLGPKATFAEVTSNASLAADLAFLYGTVEACETWVCALAEDIVPGSSVGELILASLREEFGRMAAYDASWFTNSDAFEEADMKYIYGRGMREICGLPPYSYNGEKLSAFYHPACDCK